MLLWLANFAACLSAPAVPPSDGTVIYSRRNPTNDFDTIWFAALNDTGDTLVSTGLFARVSLDRNDLVFNRNGYHGSAFNARGDVWIRNLSFNSETMVFGNNFYVLSCEFIRDGTQIIVPYRCGDFFLSLNGQGGTAISTSPAFCTDAPVINPMDGRIAFHDISEAVALIIGDTNAQNKAVIPNTALGIYPQWSQDGQWLSFTIQPNTPDSGFNLCKIKPDGTERLQLTFLSGSTNGFGHGAAWMPDGTALIGAADINGTNGLYRVAADGSGGITLLNITQPGDPMFYVGAVVGLAPPQIHYQFLNNSIVLSWSTNAAGFQLQASSGVAAGNSWTNVPGQPVVVDGCFCITNPVNGAICFYRLTK